MISLSGVSILMCTHNGAQKIEMTLKHLLAQQINSDIQWEIIVIENASTDRTFQIVNEFRLLNAPCRIRLYQEPTPGKLAALKVGVKNAKYDYLLICDDDNWPGNDYVAQLFDIFIKNPSVGVIGGKGRPVTNRQLPNWVLPHLHNFAASEQWPISSDITNEVGSVYGAGMGIRKVIYQIVLNQNWPLLLSSLRNKKSLVSGEDTEICLIARFLGYKIYYKDTLQFEHDLHWDRMTEAYFLKLIYYFGSGTALLTPYVEHYEKQPQRNIYYLILIETYRFFRYGALERLFNKSIEAKKTYYFRFGFMKSLFQNRRKIKALRTYLNVKSIASTPSNFK